MTSKITELLKFLVGKTIADIEMTTVSVDVLETDHVITFKFTDGSDALFGQVTNIISNDTSTNLRLLVATHGLFVGGGGGAFRE